MAITVTDADGSGFSLPLYNSQQLRGERQAALSSSPITSFDSDQTFLTSLEQQGRKTASGVATGPRLSRRSDYDDDPAVALAEWVQDFEAVVNGEQGTGWDFSEDYRSRTVTGVFESVTWTHNGGEKLQVEWDAEILRGEGVGTYTDPTPDRSVLNVNSVAYSIAGETASGIRQFQVEKAQPYQAFRRAFAQSPDDNDLFSQAGAERRVTVIGEKEGTDTERNTFDSGITSTLGQDETVDVIDGFTGRTITGMIDSYDVTDESGRSRLQDFAIEVVEGQP